MRATPRRPRSGLCRPGRPLALHRNNPIMKPLYQWKALGSLYGETAGPGDRSAILEMVRRHEGRASARIADHWMERQPRRGGPFVFGTAVGVQSGKRHQPGAFSITCIQVRSEEEAGRVTRPPYW